MGAQRVTEGAHSRAGLQPQQFKKGLQGPSLPSKNVLLLTQLSCARPHIPKVPPFADTTGTKTSTHGPLGPTPGPSLELLVLLLSVCDENASQLSEQKLKAILFKPTHPWTLSGVPWSPVHIFILRQKDQIVGTCAVTVT